MHEPDEVEMIDCVVPCRGRCALPERDVRATFSASELDDLAPIDQRDIAELAERSCPRDETASNVERRILAARRLKYGT